MASVNSLDFKASDRDKFIEHLEKASITVRSWPEWKRGILGWTLATLDDGNNAHDMEPQARGASQDYQK